MSIEISSISTFMFGSNEALGFHNHVLAEAATLHEQTAQKPLEEYRTSIEKLKVLLKNNMAEASADELVKAADIRRDDAYVNGLAYLGIMIKSVNPNVSKAANDIKIVFDRFPDIRRANNNTETGVLDNLIEELSKVDVNVQEQSGFTPWFKELQDAQTAFVEAVHNKNVATSRNVVALKEAKTECENAYKALIRRVNAVAEIHGEEDGFDREFIDNMNAFIDGIKNSKEYKAKIAKNGNSTTTKTTNTATTTATNTATEAAGTPDAPTATSTATSTAAVAEAASDVSNGTPSATSETTDAV